MQDDVDPAADSLLDRESRSLVQRLRLWTPARYAAAAPPWGTRADLVRHLAQSLADLAAAAEDEPRRQLPVLDSDLGVADQLMVTAHDAGRAVTAPAVLEQAAAHVLVHREDLLGEAIPAPLQQRLADLLPAVRGACAPYGRPA